MPNSLRSLLYLLRFIKNSANAFNFSLACGVGSSLSTSVQLSITILLRDCFDMFEGAVFFDDGDGFVAEFLVKGVHVEDFYEAFLVGAVGFLECVDNQ